MADGFLGRWSRRKQEVREGKPLAAEPVPLASRPANPSADVAAVTATAVPAAAHAESAVELPPPTLEDVEILTPTSDFKPFVAPGVAPEVKNAALKKLFTDPHYNVMDGLDIYIDDYSKPDPLPASMLQKMVSAQFLNLFDEEKSAPPSPPHPATQPVEAHTELTTPARPELTPEDHAHTDLRLQPNHAAGTPSPGDGTQ